MSVNMRDEIITSIDSINSVIQESEYDVTLSLLGQTTKMAFILEGCDNYYDAEQFSIFQEAEESTIASGDPSGTTANATTTVQKKKGLLGSLWEKIVKIFNAIKKFFVGDTAALTTAAAKAPKDVPEDAASLLDKITSKDPSWTKENFSAWGLTKAAFPVLFGIATGFAAVRTHGQNLISLLATYGLLNAGVKQVVFCTSGRVIKTNINFVVLASVVTRAIADIVERINYKKKLETDKDFAKQEKLNEMRKKYDQLKEVIDELQTDAAQTINVEDLTKQLDDLKKSLEELEKVDIGNNKTFIEDSNKEEEKESKVDEVLKSIPLIGTVLLSTKQFLAYIIKQLTEILQNLPLVGGFFNKKNEGGNEGEGDESSSTENDTAVTEISAKDLYESLSNDDKNNYDFDEKNNIIYNKNGNPSDPVQELKDKNNVEWVVGDFDKTKYNKKQTPEATPDVLESLDLYNSLPDTLQNNYNTPTNGSVITNKDGSSVKSFDLGKDTYIWDAGDNKYKKQVQESTADIKLTEKNVVDLSDTNNQKIIEIGISNGGKYFTGGTDGKLKDNNNNLVNQFTVNGKTYVWNDTNQGYVEQTNPTAESYVDDDPDGSYVQESFSSYYYR